MESEESRKLKESSTDVHEAGKGVLLYEPWKLSGSGLPSKDVGIKSSLGISHTFSKGVISSLWETDSSDEDDLPLKESLVRARRLKERIVEKKNNYGDPPQIGIAILRLKDVAAGYKSWESVELLTDVLLVVVTDEGFLSCYAFLRNVFKSYINELGRVYFGEIGDGPKQVTISLVRSSRRWTQVNADQNVVRTAVDVLRPKAVFFVGCCAGLRREQIQLGDVVISGTLLTCGDRKTVNDKRLLHYTVV